VARLANKVALITGGGSGIGRACALLFAQEGARVTVAGRRPDPLAAVAAEIYNAGGEALAMHCDVTDAADVTRAIETCVNRFGKLNVVVNSAGALVAATAEETSDHDWQQILAVNLTGTFLMSRAVLPELRKAGGGSIVNIGSILGLLSMKSRVAYTAAKSGVTGLTRAMALDHAHEGIRVNCICPSVTETEMMANVIAAQPDPDAYRRMRAAQIPLGRLGRPEDVAQMALYLASDESSWVTGAALPLDGGLSAY
jgi:NAD(P)-dependent dehydrogenase (short-subunit alcohol dehydrogenase family)